MSQESDRVLFAIWSGLAVYWMIETIKVWADNAFNAEDVYAPGITFLASFLAGHYLRESTK